VFRFALGEAGMVKDDFRPGALLHELEPRDRVHTRIPVDHSPALHDSLARQEFEVPSHDMPGEERERAAHFTADFRRRCPLHLAHPHGSAEVYDFVELFCVGKRFIHALPARLENRFLMNRFRRARNVLLRSRPTLG